jgi:hypothetical protein
MAKSKIRVGFSRTINTGNYESTKISVEIEEEYALCDDERYEDIFEDMFLELEGWVLKKEREVRGE